MFYKNINNGSEKLHSGAVSSNVQNNVLIQSKWIGKWILSRAFLFCLFTLTCTHVLIKSSLWPKLLNLFSNQSKGSIMNEPVKKGLSSLFDKKILELVVFFTLSSGQHRV